MMSPDDNETEEELSAVPSSMFDGGGGGGGNLDFLHAKPAAAAAASKFSGLGGFATGAGSALFAVTKVQLLAVVVEMCVLLQLCENDAPSACEEG